MALVGLAVAAVRPAFAAAQPPAAAPLPAAASASDVEKRLEELERKAQEAPVAPPSSAPIANIADSGARVADKSKVTLGGYLETYFAHNFNDPANGLTNYRGFDNRHGQLSVQNVVLDAVGALGAVTTHVAVQFGHTPEAYYASEPRQAAATGAGGSGPQVWKFLQQANVTWLAPAGRGVTLDAGLFLSPIGPEGMAVKDQWNWSRSNLFFGLPFYHTGARATYPVGAHGSASLHVYDGWNSASDNNGSLSVAAQYTYTRPDALTLNALYFGGVERDRSAPEGQPWRHLADVYAAVYPTTWLSLLAEVDAGTESNAFGRSGWAAGALYARWQARDWLYVAARSDYFREWLASNSTGSAAPMFWAGAHFVASNTLTLDARPADNLSIRLEYRRDQAEAPLYFRGQVAVNGSGAYVANATAQQTVLLGATSWF